MRNLRIYRLRGFTTSGNNEGKIKHRGPDGHGTYYNNQYKLALGHRRLAIIDLTEYAKQPMKFGSEDLFIVFNGEIYNYLELRKILREKGYHFQSQSDTEVILASYKEWGEDCVKFLNGMFAFAIWDQQHEEIFCARDRFGEKPFYYYFADNIFIFASEIKALLAYNRINIEPNDEIIHDFLVHGFLEHSNETFFKDIYKLPAAHTLKINNLKNMKLIFNKYWSFNINNQIAYESDIEEKRKLFSQQLKKSIEIRLRSDVTVGSCLSGGLDSSTIVLMVNELLNSQNSYVDNQIGKQQKVFTFCSEHKGFDEREFSDEIINVTNVEKNNIFSNSDQLFQELKELVYYQEEPFLSSSIFAQWSIMKSVKARGVKVLLDGQGADEILGGYRKYRIYLIKEYIRRGYWIKVFREMYAGFLQIKKCYNFNQDMFKILNIFNIKTKLKFEDYICNKLIKKYKNKVYEKAYNLSDALYLDINKYSIPALLRYEDKNSMAFSIESRVPFLDHEFVEYISLLPYNDKINSGWSKWILRESMKGLMPDKIRLRKDKMGFVTTEKLWIKEKADRITEILGEAKRNNNPATKYININKIIQDLPSIIEGKIEVNLWRILVLIIWFDIYFEKKLLIRRL